MLHAPFYKCLELVKFSSEYVWLGHLLRWTKTELWRHSGNPVWRHWLHVYHNMFILLFSITLVNKWLDLMFVTIGGLRGQMSPYQLYARWFNHSWIFWFWKWVHDESVFWDDSGWIIMWQGLEKSYCIWKMFGTNTNGLGTPYVSEIEETDWVWEARFCWDLLGQLRIWLEPSVALMPKGFKLLTLCIQKKKEKHFYIISVPINTLLSQQQLSKIKYIW